MSLVGSLKIAGLTDVGRMRSHNEDSISTDENIGLVVLADGMGGYKAGEVASGIATSLITSEVRAALDKHKLKNEIDEETGLSGESLVMRDAAITANRAIYETSQSQSRLSGMGTTLVSALFYDNRVTIVHVGDSRLYRLREDHFEQITKDHSLLQELVDRGFYTPEEAKKSSKKNVVTRALGVDAEVKPEVQEEIVLPNDVYLLCSDGLNDMVDDNDMRMVIGTLSGNLQLAAEQLVEMANDLGGKDNISVILIHALKPFPAKRGWFSRFSNWLDWFK